MGQIFEEINPDHIHIATEGPMGLCARQYLDKHGYRYNTAYHTKFPEGLKKLFGIPEAITWPLVRWFHKHSGKVLTTTESMVQELRAHGFDGDIVPWTRGVDRTNLRPTANRQHRSEDRKPVVLYVGRVSKEKNIDALCELHEIYDIRVVGDGPDRIRLKEKYPRVQFLGYRQGEALANCYASADVFAFPSRSDTFGLVIIEALSTGTPCAAYPVTGPIDIIEPGVTGFMHEELSVAINRCLELDRDIVQQSSMKWTWDNCWQIFKDNLLPAQ
jgi:glycosyltransferase involved in cell wall biosynthesis